MKKRSGGFTVIELILIIVVLGVASIIFFVQKNNIEVIARDNAEKTAINAMYYSLEEVFYPTNKYYPQTINSDNLSSVDPALFKDPSGVKLGTAGSAYTYSPTNCSDSKCKSYTLKATLTNEADYAKNSRNK
ncbi:MAG: type II secretion system protein [Candidatus Saccharibacteria bacterium]|nr:type II secretion system protein [Candidatus Saccharibacteria bacterium]